MTNDGVIERLGDRHEIYERPATTFVAGFIGTTNVIAGRASHADARRAVIAFDESERVVVPLSTATAAVGDELEATVRPEKIDLTIARSSVTFS